MQWAPSCGVGTLFVYSALAFFPKDYASTTVSKSDKLIAASIYCSLTVWQAVETLDTCIEVYASQTAVSRCWYVPGFTYEECEDHSG